MCPGNSFAIPDSLVVPSRSPVALDRLDRWRAGCPLIMVFVNEKGLYESVSSIRPKWIVSGWPVIRPGIDAKAGDHFLQADLRLLVSKTEHPAIVLAGSWIELGTEGEIFSRCSMKMRTLVDIRRLAGPTARTGSVRSLAGFPERPLRPALLDAARYSHRARCSHS